MLWKRYIDDVFGLFKGTKELFQSLVDWLNSLIPGVVKFTAKISYTQVEFLDLVIQIENGRLKTDLYMKPSNLQLYLNYNSTTLSPAKLAWCMARHLGLWRDVQMDRMLTTISRTLRTSSWNASTLHSWWTKKWTEQAKLTERPKSTKIGERKINQMEKSD